MRSAPEKRERCTSPRKSGKSVFVYSWKLKESTGNRRVHTPPISFFPSPPSSSSSSSLPLHCSVGPLTGRPDEQCGHMTLGGVPVIRLSGPCTNEGIAPLVVYKYPSVLSSFHPSILSPLLLFLLVFTSTGEVAFLSVCLSGCKITGKVMNGR